MEKKDMNRDPLTGEPGSHPVGTGLGSAGGALAGAGIGAVLGPIGALIGGAIGAVAGGAAGHSVGEVVDPTGEDNYWKAQHKSGDYDEFAPAYKYGWESRTQHQGRKWDDSLESDLRTGWEKAKGNSKLTWENAKSATRQAWDRSDRTYNTYNKVDNKWKTDSTSKDYFDKGMDYDRDYRPAYRYGTYLAHQNEGGKWDEANTNFEKGWDNAKGESRLAWDKAKLAAKDAWHGVERAIPGDADKDGR